MIQMEVCANSVTSALAAQQGGAIRVELCKNLAEGGTTPGYSTIKMTRQLLNIQVYPIIRPRGGDFLYSALEFALMKEDISLCKSLNCDGVVFGILTEDGQVDKVRCAALVALARPMQVTFHRAFDSSNDLEKAMEDIIELGFERILTSGGASSALLGVEKIKHLTGLAAGRISIMPGAGIREHNVAEIIRRSGATEFHSTAKAAVKSKMQFRNLSLEPGNTAAELSHELTNFQTVKNLITLANSA